MNLGELMDRCFDVLGDIRATPRFFDESRILSYMNRGCMIFRSLCRDEWHRTDLLAVIGQGEYAVPNEILELRRAAYDDITLEPRSVNVLQARDSKWQTRTGFPEAWTTVGFAQNKFFLWPIPNVSTVDVVSWSTNTGVTVRFQDIALTDYTFTRDPAGPGTWNAQFGLTVTLEGLGTESDYGDLFYNSGSPNLITVWGTRRPAVLSSDDQEIPIRRPWQIAVLWFALWQTYAEESTNANSILAAWYRDQFSDQVARCRLRTTNPVPARARALRRTRPNPSNPRLEGRFDGVTAGGTTTPMDWAPDYESWDY